MPYYMNTSCLHVVDIGRLKYRKTDSHFLSHLTVKLSGAVCARISKRMAETLKKYVKIDYLEIKHKYWSYDICFVVVLSTSLAEWDSNFEIWNIRAWNSEQYLSAAIIYYWELFPYRKILQNFIWLH